MKTNTRWILALMLGAPLAQAHVVLEQKSAVAGSYYKASFMVGHGCGGSPTTGIEIELPGVMAAVKPMPKPGWALTTQSAPAPVGLSLHGRPVTEVVTRVSWRGGVLDDAHYDEFVMLLQLPKREGPLYFRVIQQCTGGRNDWVEVPVAGQGGRLKMPAAVLELKPAAEAHHHH